MSLNSLHSLSCNDSAHVVTHVCLQAVSFGSGQEAVMLGGWKVNC